MQQMTGTQGNSVLFA